MRVAASSPAWLTRSWGYIRREVRASKVNILRWRGSPSALGLEVFWQAKKQKSNFALVLEASKSDLEGFYES
jgi:hypothetical protein